MTAKERFQRMYEHKEADRVPILDWAWGETVDRWVREGMPTRDYISHFDLDRTVELSTDNSPRLPTTVLEETEDYMIHTTPWGVTLKSFKNRTSSHEQLDFTVKDPDSWKKIKPRFTVDEDRIPWDYLKQNYKTWREEGRWITGALWFGFDITHSGMVGTENMLVAMLEEPEWVMDMFDTELNLSIALLERIWDAGYTFDEVMWYDDMGYKNAQFFSPTLYNELLRPYHQKAIDWGHAHGCVVRLHSCGDIMPLVPVLHDMGLDGLNPLEVKAGMDPIALKKQFGNDMVFHGGINAVNWDKPDIIIPEIQRVIPKMKENGGYIFASDHSIPPHVSYADFTRIINAVKEYGSY